MRKKQLKIDKIYIFYSILFLLLYFYTVWYYELKYDKMLLWNVDGVDAEYTVFVYIGQWIRSIVGGVISGRGLSIPMWDMSIGYGSDIITTFQGSLLDPFNWISAFVPSRYSESAFSLMIFLKRYFVGISFIWFGKYMKRKRYEILAGGLSYAFSVSVLIGIAQVYLIDAFYIFPLLMIGVEKLWDSKRAIPLYSFILAFSIIDSYYYTFMMGIFVGLFLVMKIIIHRKGIKDICILIARFFFGTLLGMLSGFGIQLGGIINLFSTDRMSIKHTISAFYPEWISKGMMTNFMGGVIGTGTDVLVGVPVICFICLVLLLFERGGTG